MSGLLPAVATLLGEVPVEPDADEARDWVLRELADPSYQAARPTLFDQLAQAFSEWLRSLTVPATPGGAPLGLLVLAAVVAVVLIVAFLVYGAPRLNRRSAVAGELFGQDDDRDAAAIRKAAAAAAAAGDWPRAIAEQFRAVARGLAERTVVTVSPGTTAHDFAGRAAVAFPDADRELRDAARAFDGVRYLDAPGSREEWQAVAALDARLSAARPAALEPLSGVAP